MQGQRVEEAIQRLPHLEIHPIYISKWRSVNQNCSNLIFLKVFSKVPSQPCLSRLCPLLELIILNGLKCFWGRQRPHKTSVWESFLSLAILSFHDVMAGWVYCRRLCPALCIDTVGHSILGLYLLDNTSSPFPSRAYAIMRWEMYPSCTNTQFGLSLGSFFLCPKLIPRNVKNIVFRNSGFVYIYCKST